MYTLDNFDNFVCCGDFLCLTTKYILLANLYNLHCGKKCLIGNKYYLSKSCLLTIWVKLFNVITTLYKFYKDGVNCNPLIYDANCDSCVFIRIGIKIWLFC